MLQLIEVVGILAFAIAGIGDARRKRLDLVGIYAVAFITAFGGGTLRDLMLDRTPLFWIAHEEYPVMILALTTLSLFFPGLSRVEARHLLVPDALGLGLFSISGAGYAIQADTGLFNAALLGVITGVFGGVLRDVIINEIPFVFRNTYLYATCAFVGCWVYLILALLGITEELAIGVGIVCVIGLRLASLRFRWRVPGGE
jgi:uncharacterized membrane protein YeiH